MSAKGYIPSRPRTQANTSFRNKEPWSAEDRLALACALDLSATMRGANVGILSASRDDGLVHFKNAPTKTPSQAFIDHTAGEFDDVKQARRCLSACSWTVEQLDKILVPDDVYLAEAQARDPTISEGFGQ